MVEKYDVITLRGLSAVGNHGVHDYERSGSQVFSADLTLYVDSRLAAQTDDVRNTVDYSALAEQAVSILTGTPVYLLETLADRLAQMALSYPNVFVAEVTVHKPMAPVRHQFQDVSVTIRREHEEATVVAEVEDSNVHRVVLALGANIGRPRTQLTNAIGALMEVDGVEIDEVSPLYRTKAELRPDQDPQPDYYNAVVLARTTLDPLDLLATTSSIEDQFDRERGELWAARTLDIDLIDFDTQIINLPGLELPHPRAHKRAFVLRPWVDIAPGDQMPDGSAIAALVEKAPDASGILEVTKDWLTDVELVEEEVTVETFDVGKPEVLVVPPPPPAPESHEEDQEDQEPTWEHSRSNRPAPPRRVRHHDVGGERDFLFRSLVNKEESKEKEEESQRIADEPAPAAEVFPSRRSLQAEAPKPEPQSQEMGLPDWQFPSASASPRIIDADVPVLVEDEPPSPLPQLRRRTIRPTPTGAIPVARPTSRPSE